MRLFTSELVKKYKSRTVVNHVTIDVKQGEIVGLLGPNGAGKTTTFSSLTKDKSSLKMTRVRLASLPICPYIVVHRWE